MMAGAGIGALRMVAQEIRPIRMEVTATTATAGIITMMATTQKDLTLQRVAAGMGITADALRMQPLRMRLDVTTAAGVRTTLIGSRLVTTP
jgi:hypothetical protein